MMGSYYVKIGILLVIAVLASIISINECRNVPKGYEDENGWHPGERPSE